MEKRQLRSLMGINDSGGTSVWKLNKVQMSGDTGAFRLVDLITERDKGVKAKIDEIGQILDGVILKMRWHLTKFEESGSLSSTEYDDKWKDTVTIYPTKDKGSVSAMKEKYGLSTNRIIYFYVPALKQIVRLVVKASGLSGDKNPNKELGLFEYIDEYNEPETLPCEFMTTCTGVFREGTNTDGSKNKRKDHYAMSFKSGRKLTESEFEKVEKMIIEVNEKTNAPKVEEIQADENTMGVDEPVKSGLEEVFEGRPVESDEIPF